MSIAFSKYSALLLAGFAAAITSDFAALEPTEAAEKPNIIYILADDLGYGELGCYGQTKISTPNIDRLADQGMRFTQHYSGSPVCAPSRCVLLTGKHSGHSYIRGNDEFPKGVDVWADRTLEGQHPLPPDTETFPRLLQKAGYQTAAIGKWGLGAADSTGMPTKQGFDFFFGYLCQRQAHNHYPTHLWRNSQKQILDGNRLGNITGQQYAHDLMAEESLQFIKENRARKFFLYIPFHIPHVALQVPDDSLEEYRGRFPETPYEGEKGYLPHPTPRAAYAAMITRMDKDVGRILTTLSELELDNDTLVIFSSDNGPTYAGGADSAFFRSAGPLRDLKGSLYEGGIRVPMVARWPTKIRPGSETGHISAFQDVLPTIADIAGIRTPHDTDGISFAPVLFGRNEQQQHHQFLYWEYPERGGSMALRMGKWKGIRLDAQENPDATIELYDLENDIGETKNLANQYPEIVRKITDIMKGARFPAVLAKWNYGDKTGG